jgi:hypothetical protein
MRFGVSSQKVYRKLVHRLNSCSYRILIKRTICKDPRLHTVSHQTCRITVLCIKLCCDLAVNFETFLSDRCHNTDRTKRFTEMFIWYCLLLSVTITIPTNTHNKRTSCISILCIWCCHLKLIHSDFIFEDIAYANLVACIVVDRQVILETAARARKRYFGVLIWAEGRGGVQGYRAVASDVWTESGVETIRWQETASSRFCASTERKERCRNVWVLTWL